MNLYLVLTAASAILHFQTPGAGRYYLFSTIGDHVARVEAANHPTESAHVAVTVPRDGNVKLFWVEFQPD